MSENIVKKVCAESVITIGLGVMLYGFLTISQDTANGLAAIVAGIALNAAGIFLKEKFSRKDEL